MKNYKCAVIIAVVSSVFIMGTLSSCSVSETTTYIGNHGEVQVEKGDLAVRDWEPFQTEQGGNGEYTFYAMKGESKSITLEAGAEAGVSAGMEEIAQAAVTANFHVEIKEEKLELEGISKAIDAGQTIQFYYGGEYQVYHVAVPISLYEAVDRETLIVKFEYSYDYYVPTGRYKWAHVIKDQYGEEIEDTRDEKITLGDLLGN